MKRVYSILALVLTTSASAQVQTRQDQQQQQLQQQQQQGARGAIGGIVRDAANGSPLGSASVRIAGTAFATTSKPDGTFMIENLPAGIHTLQISRIGYAPTTLADLRVRAGEQTLRDISLAGVPVVLMALDSVELVRGRAAAALYNQRAANAPGAPEYRAAAPTEGAYSPFLFEPELVMRNQGQIGLSEAQRTRIIGEMSQAQSKFTEIQWTLGGEEEKLTRLLQAAAPVEQAVTAQLDRILSLEQTLKRAQLVLLVRIKNVLTPEQQAALTRLRQREETLRD